MTAYFIFCAVLMLIGASSAEAADAAASVIDPSSVSILTELLGNIGNFSVVDWLMCAHIVALVIVNITDTPEDNRVYGKIYALLIEPLALGIGKAKQPPKSDW